jgi:signal transduction histidine kinase
MAVSGFIEIASDSPELANAPQAAAALSRAESAADRMAAMITDLLHFARIGGARPRRTDVDLDTLVATVVEDLHPVIEESDASVTANTAVTLTGDETLLRALVQNLIANAVKFSAASGVAPIVRVDAHRVSAGWRVAVDDNGPGVARELRERVFGLMERGDADDVAGTGIGLSTCRRIVEAHGGRIGIEDSSLGGASVWFVIADSAA